MDEEKQPMNVREAGRLGGQATQAKHGEAHYKRIGRLGGRRMKQLLDAGKALEEREGKP